MVPPPFLAPVTPSRSNSPGSAFEAPPFDYWKARYGFTPTQGWLDHLRLASVRLPNCSASFVSSRGLVMTNHHCAHSCIEQLSTKERDFVQTGFYAGAEADEVKCPTMEVNQLGTITDVSERVGKATAGLEGQKYAEALKAETAKIEKECATSDSLRCDVVSLFHGGAYNLYQYNRYQDVRLVFAPEFEIAFFGGDPDNFEFPRYDLDVAFVRVYDGGKPAKIADHLAWSAAGAKEGELTFVAGHPGGTDRQLTIAELEYRRDYSLPDRLIQLSQLRGEMTQFTMRGPEQKRIANHALFSLENSLKALSGQRESLVSRALWDAKVAEEAELRARLAKDPAKQGKYGGAFAAIEKALGEQRPLRHTQRLLEGGGLAGGSELFGVARMLVRAPVEQAQPNEKRLREYRDSSLPALRQRLFSKAPIYDELEIEQLRFGLTKLRELLGSDDAVVKKVLGKESPEQLARRLVTGSKLRDLAVRQKLWDGGKAAVDGSDDPIVQLARLVDPDARAIRKKFEDDIESVLKKNDELVAKARGELFGTDTYPDATFTLRLSYGAVKGYSSRGHEVRPLTTIGGAFEHATGQAPFQLPQSWLGAKARLNAATPMNFCASNDIIGGNSGSPVFNKDAQVVGLVFDGNMESLGGNFGYDGTANRMVAVHSEALIEALGKIYGADRIVRELRPAAAGKAKK